MCGSVQEKKEWADDVSLTHSADQDTHRSTGKGMLKYAWHASCTTREGCLSHVLTHPLEDNMVNYTGESTTMTYRAGLP